MNRKPVFDAVKTMIGGHFNDDQVKALDLACDLALTDGFTPKIVK